MAVQVRNRRDATAKLAQELKNELGARSDHEWYQRVTPDGSHPTPAELERLADARNDLSARLGKLIKEG